MDLRPRAWKWMKFMDTYRDLLPEASDKETYALYMSLILDLRTHGETKDLIEATPGVRVVVARAWAIFLGLDNCISDAGFHDVCRVLGHDLKRSLPVNLEEMIEGAGGSVADLALLLIKHINVVVSSGQPPSDMTELFLVGVIGLLDETDYNGTLQTSLLSAGIVETLMSGMCFLAGTRVPRAFDILRDFFTLMSKIFTTYPAPMCIPDALHSGLFRLICICAVAHANNLRGHMKSLMREVLPPAMVYYSVLTCLEGALVDAQEAASDV
ncbi:hypothetical protein FB451DRAFT_576939 [Mycena latifolia]|nr:hypothetical protein FB451DRAFT_576939 [Mycena latifolia]